MIPYFVINEIVNDKISICKRNFNARSVFVKEILMQDQIILES